MAHLEGGPVGLLNPGRAIFIPAGWSHAVFTIHGGFLVSTDYTTKHSIWPFSQYLKHRLQRDLDAVGQRDCYFLFLRCLEVSLHNDCSALALQSWSNICSILEEQAQRDSEWKLEAQKTWQTAIDQCLLADGVCSCNNTVLGSFEQHDYKSHLGWLFESDVQQSGSTNTLGNPPTSSTASRVRRSGRVKPDGNQRIEP